MNENSRRWVLSACLALLMWLCPQWAHGQSDPVTAQALFDAAKRLMDAGSYAEACPKLAESHRLDPAGGTLLNLAICNEQLGKTATAWEMYKQTRDLALRDKRDDRAALAQEYITAVEPKLSRLTLEVPAGARVAGLVVTRNGVEVGAAAWGLAIPTDPGELVVEARAPGHEPWSTKVVLGASAANQTVTVPALRPTAASSGPPPAPSGPTLALTAGPDEPAPESGNGLLVAGIVVASIGGVAAAVGAVFGGLAIAKEGDANDLCGSDEDTCPSADGLEASDTARSHATVANALIFGGLGMAAAGVLMAVLAPKNETEAARLVPWVDVGGAGVIWQVAW